MEARLQNPYISLWSHMVIQVAFILSILFFKLRKKVYITMPTTIFELEPEDFYVAHQAQKIELSQLCRLTESEHSKTFRRRRAQGKCAESTTKQIKWERNHDSLQAGLLH